MSKKPSPPSKFASDTVKATYAAKLEAWERSQHAPAPESDSKPVDGGAPADGVDAAVADVAGESAAAGAASEVGAGTPEAADAADLGATAASDSEPEQAVRHDGGDAIKLDVAEILDPTEASREQYEERYQQLQLLITSGAATDPKTHDEVQQLADWIEAYETHRGDHAAQLIDDALGLPPVQAMARDLAAGRHSDLPYGKELERIEQDNADRGATSDAIHPGKDARATAAEVLREGFGEPGVFGLDFGGPDKTVIAEVEDGKIVSVRELPDPVSNPLDHALLNPAVKITTDDPALGAALVEAGATSVHIVKPTVDTFGWLGEPIPDPAATPPAPLATEPPVNGKRRRYTTKTGQHQTIGGVPIPGGEHGLVLGPDDHRLTGFVGYFLNVEDVEDVPPEE